MNALVQLGLLLRTNALGQLGSGRHFAKAAVTHQAELAHHGRGQHIAWGRAHAQHLQLAQAGAAALEDLGAQAAHIRPWAHQHMPGVQRALGGVHHPMGHLLHGLAHVKAHAASLQVQAQLLHGQARFNAQFMRAVEGAQHRIMG